MIPEVAFNDMADRPEEQARWAAEMTYTATGLFASPSEHEPWTAGVPCGYIHCTADNALPYPMQQGMAAALGADAPISTLEGAGHCPHNSRPKELIAAVKEVAGKLVGSA